MSLSSHTGTADAGATSPGSADCVSPQSDSFSDKMSTVGLKHTNERGERVFLKAKDLPEELDLFHLPPCIDGGNDDEDTSLVGDVGVESDK